MTSIAKPRMDVVKREDKETRLNSFILNHLNASVARTGAQDWLLIARSPESPVVVALSNLAPVLQRSGIKVQALFTQCAPGSIDQSNAANVPFASDVRFTNDLRILDAHEQLRLDATTSWVGDCMRREPAKRDAFECYATGCAITADWSAKAFERLWSKGEPCPTGMTKPVVEEVVAAPAEEFSVPAPEVPSTVVVSTRH